MKRTYKDGESICCGNLYYVVVRTFKDGSAVLQSFLTGRQYLSAGYGSTSPMQPFEAPRVVEVPKRAYALSDKIVFRKVA
jgi:hypothetical protein